jgi:hypothetical protein
VTEVRPVQLKKAELPILVTLWGMVIEVRAWQLSKALMPILVMLLGMVIEVRPEQTENILSIENQLLIR